MVGAKKYLLGFDIGSSSVKGSVIDSDTGAVCASAHSPETELSIVAPHSGWAEQHPDTWWEHIVKVSHKLKQSGIDMHGIQAVGISYQMHGLVCVDSNYQSLRPAIIWCDSRAVEIGKRAFETIGAETCYSHLLNSPGNFTASKLKWVKDNEPDIYNKIYKVMLPGDYIALKLTGLCTTTVSGLSEGMLWDYSKNSVATILLDYYGIDKSIIPDRCSTFSVQGEVTAEASNQTGIKAGTPVSYRAGDQPNNAFSLNVLNPGELAATAGTSGVIYGVAEEQVFDKKSRVNTFVHVNNSEHSPRYGVLLCVNGTGILNSWVKQNMGGISYSAMDSKAMSVSPGAEGLLVFPYGNGAERTLGNFAPGASFHNLDFNRHNPAHLYRAVQEGIVYALNYGFDILKNVGVKPSTIKAGLANMFLSPLFCEALAAVTNTPIELYNTDGAQGAARGAGVGIGLYPTANDAYKNLSVQKLVVPTISVQQEYCDAYGRWRELLEKIVKS